jgi:outer membrane protein assembly factor BamD (BamD/ComL family)
MEAEAEQPHPPKGAAEAAHLLYKRVPDYFPTSPLAAEAAWRAADIRWQLDKLDISTLPSAKEQQAYLRPQIYDGAMKKLMKTYPGTSYAARAAYEMLDNKLCGDWQGLPKCPEMESGLYEKYARQYPDSPKAAEALYNATYRQGVAVTMYNVQDDKKKADEAAKRTADLAQQMQQQYPKSDYTARAAAIAYKVQQGIPVYGSDRD